MVEGAPLLREDVGTPTHDETPYITVSSRASETDENLPFADFLRVRDPFPVCSFVHFVGFRDDRYHAAVRAFGQPDFIHIGFDRRALREISEGDVIVFADGPADQKPRAKSFPDILDGPQLGVPLPAWQEGVRMGEWINHDGYKPKCNGLDIVEVKFRDGSTTTAEAGYISAWCWMWREDIPDTSDIMSYRVLDPSPRPQHGGGAE